MAKGELPWAKTLLLAIMAGCYISFGNMLAIVVGGGVPNADPGIQKFLYGLVFPVGLMLVVISGAELVTVRLSAAHKRVFLLISSPITVKSRPPSRRCSRAQGDDLAAP